MHKMVFSWGVVLELVKGLVKAEGGRTPRMGSAPANLRKQAGAARDSRYVWERPLSISGEQPQRRIVQNGRTITSTTIIAAATPGISFIIRIARFESGRSPRASFLP